MEETPTAKILAFTHAPPQNRKCSFCGTKEKDAKKFIASEVTNHCICGECVSKATTVLKESEVKDD